MGFLLGNSTKEEHKEIKKYALVLIDVLKLSFFVVMFVLFFGYLFVLGVVFVLFIVYVVFNLMKKNDLMRFWDIMVFSLCFILLSVFEKGVFFIVVFLMALVLENSFRKFKVKEEVYVLVLYVLIYASYMFLGNWF
jgi:hypothetical protein